jgi:hypothetical protein
MHNMMEIKKKVALRTSLLRVYGSGVFAFKLQAI